MAKRHSNRANGARTPAVAYIRMSSAKQESSPAQQRREIAELAKRKGYKIVEWYIDEGISGDEIEKRPDFCRMLEDAGTGKYTVILCWDQDRFGRFDSLKAGYVIEPLRMRGIRLVTITQGEIDWNDFAGRMMYAIQQEGKNQFLHGLSQNVLRGRMQATRNGHGVARAPYGFDRVFYDAAGNLVHRVYGGEKFAKPKAWISKLDISENTEEVDTVRFIFDRYVNSDVSLNHLAYELNQQGIRTRCDRPWGYRNLKLILINPAYIGTLTYGKTPQGRFNWVGNGGVGGDEPIVFENAHPAIIDQRTFDKAQQKLRERGSTNRRRYNDYLLSGLVVCGVTGEKMFGRATTFGQHLRYYTAKQFKESEPGQRCFSIRKDQLEPFVLGKIVEILNQPQLCSRIEKALTKKLKARKAKPADRSQLKKRLADLDGRITQATERMLLIDADGLEDANRILAGWRKERRRIADKLERTTVSASSSFNAEVDAVMARLANLNEVIGEADPLKVKAALRASIESITIYWGPGGPRRWKLKRGVIRFSEALLVALPWTK